jgi:TRAP-type uncharacterized transport system substrate-binding protein
VARRPPGQYPASAGARWRSLEDGLRIFLAVCAIVLAVMAVSVGAFYFTFRATELKIAVPASATVDQRVIGAAAAMLRAQRAPVRLELVTSESTKAALEALESGKVNLAVVRSDTALQGPANTVMIMRREVAVLIAPKDGKLQKVTDLPESTIGIAREGLLEGTLLSPVLDYYGIARDSIKFVTVAMDDIANQFREQKIDAIVVVGGASSMQTSDMVAAVAKGVDDLQFINLEEADAIAKRLPALESTKIEQGTFGGRPPRPAEAFNTLGFSVRMVATPATDNDTVADLMRNLYLIRQNISAAIPGAGLMTAPDVEEETSFLIHPGVRGFVNGEQRTWFDKYGDYLYVSLFIVGGIGSVAAGTFGWLRRRNHDRAELPVQRIEAVLDAVRDAKSADELDAAERDADAIFRAVFGMGAAGQLTVDRVASFDMALGELRNRIATRRCALR